MTELSDDWTPMTLADARWVLARRGSLARVVVLEAHLVLAGTPEEEIRAALRARG